MAIDAFDTNYIGHLEAQLADARRTLATLTREGIVVGEDGAARWHGLTGAEIEAMKSKLSTFYYVNWEWISHFDPDEPDAVVEPGYKLFHVYESKPMCMGWPVAHYKDEGEAHADSDRRNAALAAAAGRGADGEAGE